MHGDKSMFKKTGEVNEHVMSEDEPNIYTWNCNMKDYDFLLVTEDDEEEVQSRDEV